MQVHINQLSMDINKLTASQTTSIGSKWQCGKVQVRTWRHQVSCNCLLLEEQLGLQDLESTEQAQSCKQSIPAAVVCDDNGHGHPGIKSRMGQTHIGSGEDIYSTNEDAHHLGNDHNTTCQIQSQGSVNGNVHSGNLSLI